MRYGTLLFAVGLLLAAVQAQAAVLKIDDPIVTQTSYLLDPANVDSVTFAATDGTGLGLLDSVLGTTHLTIWGSEACLTPGSEADFLAGATSDLGLGLAWPTPSSAVYGVTVDLYHTSDGLLGPVNELSGFTLPDLAGSSEALPTRYSVGTVRGKFGSEGVLGIPEPASVVVWSLLTMGLLGAYRLRRRNGSPQLGGGPKSTETATRQPWDKGTTEAILDIVERGRMSR